MAHQIESMMYVGETPWHGLGVQLDNPPTVEEALVAAGLNWGTSLQPMYAKIDTNYVQVESRRAHVRDTDNKVLGVVGTDYHPLSNVEAFRFFEPYMKTGNFTLETAGSLAGGSRVWILASLKKGVAEVVKGDPIKQYILLCNSHDGSMSVSARDTCIRVVCANTEAMAKAESKAAGHLRHTKNVSMNLDKLNEAIAERHELFKHSLEQYRALASKQINEKQLISFISEVRRKDVTKPAKGEEQREDYVQNNIVQLFEHGRGQDNPRVKGTLWAAMNAVTEWVDHHRGGENRDREVQLNSAWFGGGMHWKERALEVGLKMAA